VRADIDDSLDASRESSADRDSRVSEKKVSHSRKRVCEGMSGELASFSAAR
jgi:hypothetical protein